MDAFFGDVPVTVLDVQTVEHTNTTQALIAVNGTETWVPYNYLDFPYEDE